MTLTQFSDSFSGAALDPTWQQGAVAPTVGGGLATFTLAAGTNATTGTTAGPIIGLLTGGSNFYVQLQLASLAITTGSQIAAFGVGVLGASLVPIVEFGGIASGSPSVYFSRAYGSNEIGDIWSISGLPASSFLLRVVRADSVTLSEYSTDSGVTWQAWDSVIPSRTVDRRYYNREGEDTTNPVTEQLVLYVRTATAQDAAGLAVSIDNVYYTSWARYANPLTSGSLYARAWAGGGRIDLSWTNPMAGGDEPRSMTIVRSLMAPPELLPPDLVVEPVPLVDADFTTPAPLWLPLDAVEWAARYPGVSLPTVFWRMAQEIPAVPTTVASVLPAIGTGTLVAGNQVNLSLSEAVGINLGNMRRYSAPEFVDTLSSSPSLAVSNNPTLADPSASTSVTVWAVFRSARFASATRSIVSNIDGAASAGWQLTVNVSGQLIFNVVGSTSVSLTLPSTAYVDGGWHAVMLVIDWVAGTIQAWSDLDGYLTGSTLPTISSLLGSVFTLGNSAVNTSQHMQVAAAAVWQGPAALSVREAQAKLLYTHGQLPFTLPAGFTSAYSRTGIAAGSWGWAENTRVGSAVAKFSGSTSYAQAHVWYRHNVKYEHATGLELAADVAASNLLADSESGNGLALTSVTTSLLGAGAPDGLHTAVVITQTALDGRAFFSVSGLSTNTVYWVSVYLLSNNAGHKATLWIRDNTDSTAVINQQNVVYLQPYWKRFSFQVNTSTATGIGVRVYAGIATVDTAKSISIWGRAIQLGTYLPDYVPVSAALAGSRGVVGCVITAPALGQVCLATRGEVRAQITRLASSIGSAGTAWRATRADGSQADERDLLVSSGTDQAQLATWNGSAAALSTISTPTLAPSFEPVEIRADWSSATALTGAGTAHLELFANGTSQVTGQTSAFSAGAGVNQLYVGCSSLGGGSSLRGGVAFVRLYASTPACDGSNTPFNVGLDPLGKVVYTGVPLGSPGGAASFTDTAVVQGRFYYYGIFVSRVPPSAATFAQPMNRWTRLLLAPADTDVGPKSPDTNRVGGHSLVDRITLSGNRFYNKFPDVYRRADEEDRKAQSRATGLLYDLAAFMQRGLDQAHGIVRGMIDISNPEIAPLGLIGNPVNQTAIVDAFLREFSVNPDAGGLLGTARRRLWGGVVGILKRKGVVSAVGDYVTLLTGWEAAVVTQPSIDTTARFLRTWDGNTSLQPIVSPATNVTVAPGSVTVSTLALSPNKFVGGLYVDWFGNVKPVAANTATQIVFDDSTFVAQTERTFSATVTGTNSALLPTPVNDAQYNFGFIHETGLGAAVAITGTSSATQSVTTAGGLTNGAGQAIAIAAAYTGNFAARVPTFTAWLWNGEHSALYDPEADLSLRGSTQDPFFTLWPGLSPTGSGHSFPVTDDDVVIWAPRGAARCASRPVLWTSVTGDAAIIGGGGAPDVRPGDYINPNRNQGQWFRITGVHQLGTSTYVQVSLIGATLGIRDVAALYDLATIAARQTVEHDRAVRAMIPAILPVNGRCFVYYQE